MSTPLLHFCGRWRFCLGFCLLATRIRRLPLWRLDVWPVTPASHLLVQMLPLRNPVALADDLQKRWHHLQADQHMINKRPTRRLAAVSTRKQMSHTTWRRLPAGIRLARMRTARTIVC